MEATTSIVAPETTSALVPAVPAPVVSADTAPQLPFAEVPAPVAVVPEPVAEAAPVEPVSGVTVPDAGLPSAEDLDTVAAEQELLEPVEPVEVAEPTPADEPAPAEPVEPAPPAPVEVAPAEPVAAPAPVEVAAEAPATELTPGQKLVQFGEAIQTMQAVDVPQPGQLAPELRQLQENMPAPVAGVDVPLPVAEETEAYKVALAAQDARAAATAALAAEEAKGLPVGTAGAAPAQLTDAQVGMEGKTDVVLEAGLAPSRAVLRVAVSRAFVSQTAAEAAVGVETVNMTFPRTVYLTLPDRSQIVFQAGVQPVPVDLSTHSYLVANGVTLVTPNPTRVLDPVLPGASTTAALDSRIAKK